MAAELLTPDLERTLISEDGTESTFSDSTTYGAGGDPARNAVAIYLTAYKVDEDQEETALTVTTFDPELATTFTVENGDDGWHKYYFIIADNWSVATEYSRYQVVWSTTENKFYQYTNATPSTGNAVTNSIYFTHLPDPTVVIEDIGTDEEPDNIAYQVVDKILREQTSICYLKSQALKAKESCGCDDCGCDSKLTRYATRIRDLFAVLAINESTGQYIEGEKNARLAEKYCDECGCLEQ